MRMAGVNRRDMDFDHTSTLREIPKGTLTRIKQMVATIIILTGTTHMAVVTAITMKNASMPMPVCHR